MQAYLGGALKLHATNRGLVWDTRRVHTIETAFIDAVEGV